MSLTGVAERLSLSTLVTVSPVSGTTFGSSFTEANAVELVYSPAPNPSLTTFSALDFVQVFDTGDRMSLPYARQLERMITRHRMPFRLGVGAFERQLANGVTTSHREWFGAARVMTGSTWFRGVWVFPGGSPWASMLDRTP